MKFVETITLTEEKGISFPTFMTGKSDKMFSFDSEYAYATPVYCKYKDSWLVAVKVDSRLEEHWRGIVYNILPLYNSNYLFYAKAISQEFEIFKDSGHALRWAMNYVDNQKSGA